MRATRRILLGAGLLAAAAPAFAGEVSVTFVRPEQFTDASASHSFPNDRDRAWVQREIEQHLRALAARKLAPDESLNIEVLDLDLAGGFEPFRLRHGADVRVVRDVTWPRMRLRYALLRDQGVIASAEERLADMNFLLSTNRYPVTDRLRYEKAMLDAWFDRRFATR